MDPHHALPLLTACLSMGYKFVFPAASVAVPIVCMGLGLGGSAWLHKQMPRNLVLAPIIESSKNNAERKQFSIGVRRIKADSENGLPPFTIFYPSSADPAATTSTQEKWLPEEEFRYVEGVARYGKVPPYAMRSFKDHLLTAIKNGEFFQQDQNVSGVGSGALLPPSEIIIFSHGLAGHQGMYSTFSMELVHQAMERAMRKSNSKLGSEGVACAPAIVLAIGHSEGSASFSPSSVGGSPYTQDTVGRSFKPESDGGLFYHREPEERNSALTFRANQLDMRNSEIDAVLKFCTSGRLASTLLGKSAASSGLEIKLFPANPKVHLVGHSFGGAGVVWASLDAALRAKYNIMSTVALDLWCDPVMTKIRQLQKELDSKVGSGNKNHNSSSSTPPATKNNSSIPPPIKTSSKSEIRNVLSSAAPEIPPLLLMDSEQWERWKGNVKEEEEVMKCWDILRELDHEEHVMKHRQEQKHKTVTVVDSPAAASGNAVGSGGDLGTGHGNDGTKTTQRLNTPATCHMSLSDIVFMATMTTKAYTDRSKLSENIQKWAKDTLSFQRRQQQQQQ